MQKDQSYHESAIRYNEGLAEFAETLAPTLEHEEVRRWCTAVGKQHRFHAKRHRSALNKILLKLPSAPVEVFVDGMDVPDPDVDEQVSASGTEVEDVITTETDVKGETLSDGCTSFHNPSNPTCEFYPKEVTRSEVMGEE